MALRIEVPDRTKPTSGDVLRAIGAFALLVVLFFAPPLALIAIAGAPPLPSGVPDLDRLREIVTTPDDGTLLIGFLELVGWIAWATFAVSVVIEIPAAVRGRAAKRVPGLRLQQRAAAGLVGVIMAALVSGPVASGAVVSEPVVVASPPDTSGSTTSSPVAATSGTYVVRPGDTLWEIAERRLGDGRRWPEIAELNYGQPQPNAPEGLRDPDWIDAGWQLVIPLDTTEPGSPAKPETHTVIEGDTLWGIAAAHLGPDATDAEIATEWPRWYERNRDVIGDDPDLILPGTLLQGPDAPVTPPTGESTNRPVPDDAPDAAQPSDDESIFEPLPEPDPPSDEQEPQPEPAPEPEHDAADGGENDALTVLDAGTDNGPNFPDIPVRTVGGIGSLLAAGLVGVLAVRRRRQHSKRIAGERTPFADGDAAITEQALWDVADEFGVEAVDRALRAIAASCLRNGTRLPVVRAARLTADQFELYLDEPAVLPSPWTQADDDYVWSIAPGANLDSGLSAADVRDTPAPYPGLVTIGHDTEGGHILLDLEHVGLLAIDGSQLRVGHVMTALAIELATSSWADDATIAVVGICSELAAALGTGRLRYVDTVADLLTMLESHAAADRPMLSASGVSSAASARSQGAGEWYPEIALVASPLSDAEASRLQAVLGATPRLAIAAVVTGGSVSADWTISLDPADPEHSVLEPLGLAIAPQLVNATDYRAVVDMFAAAQRDPMAEAPRGIKTHESVGTGDTAVDVADVTQPMPDLDPRDGPVIRMLGPVHIDGARGTADPSHVGQLTEIAAYIALHPGCSSDDLDAAIWPGEPLKGKTRAQACSRLRNWLGDDEDGSRYLPQMSDGGYRFAPGVRTDWAQFQRLIGSGALASVPVPQLKAALELVRGQPFTGTTGRRPKYRWADRLRATMIETIADAACAVASAALDDGSPHTARDAATVGLQVEPGMEQLWRLLVTAEHDAGNLAAVQAAVDKLYALFDELGTQPEPATAEMISRLSPATSYRRAGVK